MNDPLVQTLIVAIAINIAAGLIAFYLWTEHRSERFLLFWALSWSSSVVRWLIHYPAESRPALRAVEGLLISVTMFFMVMGAYDMLPAKPWRDRLVVGATGLILLAYAVGANTVQLPIEMGYALYAAVLAFTAICTGVAFRVTRLPGYGIGAATCAYQLALVSYLLVGQGRGIADSVLVPLFNIPLMLSIVVVAYQRQRRRLMESEHTLQKIFDTAPTPIVIVRPPSGEIERANAVAMEMLGVSLQAAIGRTVVEQGLVPDSPTRRAIRAELEAGRRVTGRELTMFRAGREMRTMSVNADRITLDSGDRFVYSFFDLTDLRQAEEELRASAERMRQMYVRLATVEDGERRALHTELHDQVGANLTALRLELDVASGLLAANDSPAAEQHLGSARAVVTETIAMARNLMGELRPPALDDYGLVAALAAFAESQSPRLSLAIHVTGDDLVPRPGARVEGALFRIVQEAVMNAARHASATRVGIDVATRDGRVILTVEDDGIGFDPEAPGVGPDHWGLKTMRERAQAVGGTLQVETAPGAGTRIVADAPREGA